MKSLPSWGEHTMYLDETRKLPGQAIDASPNCQIALVHTSDDRLQLQESVP